MQLRAKDDYKVECDGNISTSELFSLSVLYAPILSANSVKLYLFLICEAERSSQKFSHQRVCSLLDLSITEVETARTLLEEVLLMRTYYKQTSALDHYVYEMQFPLSPTQFLNHDVFGRMYVEIVGIQQFEVTKQLCLKSYEPKQNYVEVTKPFQNKFMVNWDEQKEEQFNEIRPNNENNKGTFDLPITFDYDAFLSGMSLLVFPMAARSKESLKIVGELATIYGITVERMKILAPNSLDAKTEEVSEEKLRLKCRRFIGEYTEENNQIARTKYDIPPVQFLRQFQNGAELSSSDSLLLEDLVRKMNLEPGVVNVLVEYVLNNYDMRFDRRLVEKIASTWVRLKIKTVEDALTNIQSQEISVKKNIKKEEIIPKWHYEAKNNTANEKETVEDISKQRELYLQQVKNKGK